MRVYHYLEAKWALDDIRRRRLKLSKIDDMNDPYELRCVYSCDLQTRGALEKTADETVESNGVLCLSRSWNNILMWSHYGDKHRGVCLGFDVPDEMTGKTKYVKNVRKVGRLIVESRSDFSREKGTEVVERMLWAKYAGWSYEQEIRIYGERNEVDEETGFYFVDFSDRLKLTEVIAGVKFPLGRRPIEEALEGYSEDVRIVKAARSPTKFEIIEDENGFGEVR